MPRASAAGGARADAPSIGAPDASTYHVRPEAIGIRILHGGNMGNMTAQVSSEMHNAVTEELISARRLWTAVLLNAVEDWRNGTLRARREAQTFLFDNDEDFAMVCNNAGLDFSDFRVRLLKIGRRVEARVPFSLCLAS
jgi:hypothetical protein